MAHGREPALGLCLPIAMRFQPDLSDRVDNPTICVHLAMTNAFHACCRIRADREVDFTGTVNRRRPTEFIEIGSAQLAGLLPREDGGVLAMVKYGSNSLLEVGLACFKADGTLDSTFGEGGKIFHRIPTPAAAENRSGPTDDAFDASQGSQAAGNSRSIAAAQDGAFYCLLGSRFGPFYALMRCQSNGRLDLAFNGTGFVTDGEWQFRSWGANDMVVTPDGRVTLVGIFQNIRELPARLAFWRFNPDGSLDHSFGDEGYAFFDADFANVDPKNLSQMELLHAETLPNGGTAACGYLTTRSEANVFQTSGLLACLDSSGNLLDTFNDGKALLFGIVFGRYETDFRGGLGLQADGKIVIGATSPQI